MTVLPTNRAQTPPATEASGYQGAVINEIRMLLDFVTGSPVQTLRDLAIPDPCAAPPAGRGGSGADEECCGAEPAQ